jgi:hypothetical protein
MWWGGGWFSVGQKLYLVVLVGIIPLPFTPSTANGKPAH